MLVTSGRAAQLSVKAHTALATRFATLIALLAVAATAMLAAATPAVAAPRPVEGYVWGWQPANPNYYPMTGYEYNSAGGKVQIVRPAAGTYQVRFHGMAGTGGIAHVSAYGAARLCAVANYGPSGTDQVLNLRCYDMAGALVDTAFVAHVTNRTDGAVLGYLWSNDPTPPVTGNVPPAQWSYDSTGQPIVVYRSAVGHYRVELGAFAQDSGGDWEDGFLRVTPYGAGARHCQVKNPAWAADPEVLEVDCFNDTGLATDTRFTFTYSRDVLSASATVDNLGGAPVVAGWTNSAGGAPAAAEVGEGDYVITFPDAGVPRGFALGSVISTPPMFCTIHSWWPSAGDQNVRVRCYDGGNGDPNPGMFVNVGFIAG